MTLIFASLALLSVGGLILALAARLAFQARNARRLRLQGPDIVDEAGYVQVNGADQWIQVRGRDRRNDILLVVHGGPSFSMIPFVYPNAAAWEERFVVCHWDQRDAGLTLQRRPKDAPPATLDLFVDDGIAVAQHLLQRLERSRLVLLGISWGSVVGLEMVRRRPDLFSAYVASGQVIDFQQGEVCGYAALAQRLERSGALRDLKRLRRIVEPPYPDRRALVAQRRILSAHPPDSERGATLRMLRVALAAPGYSLRQILRTLTAQPEDTLVRDLMSYDAAARGCAFGTPLLFLQGEEDIQSPTPPIRDFMESITAPDKRLVVLPGLGHQAVVTEPFLRALVENL